MLKWQPALRVPENQPLVALENLVCTSALVVGKNNCGSVSCPVEWQKSRIGVGGRIALFLIFVLSGKAVLGEKIWAYDLFLSAIWYEKHRREDIRQNRPCLAKMEEYKGDGMRSGPLAVSVYQAGACSYYRFCAWCLLNFLEKNKQKN